MFLQVLLPLIFIAAFLSPLFIAIMLYWQYRAASRSGWSQIAELYPPKKLAGSEKKLFLRQFHFSSIVFSGTIYTDQEGFTFKRHFRPLLITLPRAIFIPWKHLQTEMIKTTPSNMLGHTYQLHLPKAPYMKLYIVEQLAMELQDASNGCWHYQ